MRTLLYLIPFLFLVSCKNPTPKEQDSEPPVKAIGEINKLDLRLDEVLDTNAQIEVIAEGYDWSEGPLWLESEQMLIWSDVPANTIYSWQEGSEARVYLQPSGYTGEAGRGGESGSNGLLLNADGELVLCQHGDRRVTKMMAPVGSPQPEFITIADQYDGKRFNSPNDAAFDQDGHLYFTDPPYGLEKQMDDSAKELPFQGVYRVSPEGEVFLLTDELSRPNGIAFSPDYSKCYVANSDPERAVWMVYDIDENKNFRNGRVFFDATPVAGSQPGLPDGLKVRQDGTLFATGPGGVLVFTPEGEHLGTISPGQATSNCAFNANESVLFMTADLYVAKLELRYEK